MIFDVLRHRWLRLELEKISNVERERQLRQVRSLIVYYDQDFMTDLKVIDRLAKSLNVENVTCVAFAESSKAESRSGEQLVRKSSIKWNGGLKDDEVQDILNKSYDLQINFLNQTDIFKSYILQATQAKLKVGFPDQDAATYDLAIEVDRNQEKQFIEELNKYVNIILN